MDEPHPYRDDVLEHTSKAWSTRARDVLRTRAAEHFRNDGNVVPHVRVYTMKDVHTGAALPQVATVVVPMVASGAEQKEAWAADVRKLCLRVNAFAVGFISEAYKNTPDKARRDGTLKGVAGTVEVLQLVWEHCSFRGLDISMATIAREVDGDESSPGTLGDWDRQVYERGFGRMDHFLPGAGGN